MERLACSLTTSKPHNNSRSRSGEKSAKLPIFGEDQLGALPDKEKRQHEQQLEHWSKFCIIKLVTPNFQSWEHRPYLLVVVLVQWVQQFRVCCWFDTEGTWKACTWWQKQSWRWNVGHYLHLHNPKLGQAWPRPSGDLVPTSFWYEFLFSPFLAIPRQTSRNNLIHSTKGCVPCQKHPWGK